MSRESLIIILGALIGFTPYLGIPSDWKHIMYIATGVLLVVVGYSLRRSAFFRSIETESGERQTDSYAENHIMRTKQEKRTEVTV